MTPQAVFRQHEAGVLAGMLSTGMRAVAVPVTPTNAAAGFILPNDHVDIVLNQDVRAVATGNGNEQLHGDFARFASEAVLRDVRVVAVDDKLVKPDGAANMAGKTVTVEVTPKDAEILLTALRMGEITLALRSTAVGESGDAPALGYTSDVAVSRALQTALGIGRGTADPKRTRSVGSVDIRINRGGSTSTQSFTN